MSFDTTQINRTRRDLRGCNTAWLFGYGSLIFKTGFPYLECRPACIHGWVRRFWQGSHDHRGTPEHPGRVATPIPLGGATCAGMAYRVAAQVFEQLDFREKNGYLCFTVPLYFDNNTSDEGVIYIAGPDNAAWLGPTGEMSMAQNIAQASGPSGSNSEYLLRLAESLRDMGVDDPRVFALEKQVRFLLGEEHGELR